MDDLGKKSSRWPALCDHEPPSLPAGLLQNAPMHGIFKQVIQAFRQQAVRMMRAAGIADIYPGAAPLILHLGEEDGLTLSELARRCGLENSTLTPLVDELERFKIARRDRDPRDRRIVRIYLTPHGQTLAPRLRQIVQQLQETAYSGLSEAELEIAFRVLERMAQNLNALPGNEAERETSSPAEFPEPASVK